jgi:hypothetical protein
LSTDFTGAFYFGQKGRTDMPETIVVALIAFAGTLCGSFFSHRKSTALIAYRLEQLEEKVNQHNSLIDRTYKVEGDIKVLDEKIKVANNRIKDLERGEYDGKDVLTTEGRG